MLKSKIVSLLKTLEWMFIGAMVLMFLSSSIFYIYYDRLPAEKFFEMKNFSVEDITTSDRGQLWRYEREVPFSMRGEWFDELILMEGNTSINRYRMTGESYYEFFPPDQDNYLYYNFPAEWELEPGDYYWQIAIDLKVRQTLFGYVHKRIEFTSNEFTVTGSVKNT